MFEWRANGVKKQTCVAYPVAAQKNICQVCMTDLTFGLPVAVRDAFLKSAMEKGVEGVNEMFGSLPQSRVGQDYMFNQQLAARASADAGTLLLKDDSSEALSSFVQGATAHVQSSESGGYRFKLPEICASWVIDRSCKLKKNLCSKRPCCGLFKFPELPPDMATRLETELKSTGPENAKIDESIRKKLKGIVHDLEEKNQGKKDDPSTENSFRTIFVSKLADDTTEEQLRSVFSKFPGVVRVSVVQGKYGGNEKVGFVEFSTKQEAQFVLSLSGLMVGNASVHLALAKSQSKSFSKRDEGKTTKREPRHHHHQQHPQKIVDSSSTKKKPEEEEEEMTRKRQKSEPEREISSKATAPAAPQALLNALKLRKAKGLDDDE